MKHFKYKKHPDHAKHVIKRAISWFAMFVFMAFSVYMVELNETQFQVSIIPTKSIPAFDGTVYPIQKVPNWVALTTDEWKYSYSQIPASKLINTPVYDPAKLQISTSSLKWGNAADDAIRNAKITYSVPYMGNYELDGREFAGSHLAVDIKIPAGTPVYAIANGEVVKTENLSSGFGNHIVVLHENVPGYNNSSQKGNYFSSYSHLQSIKVSDGQVVRKGDLIGYSGSSGLSTTPHLHFQIDNSNAPWHPFWPFTSKDASNAGLSFTEAINTGLNQNIAIANTVNPVMYVQKYINNSGVNNTVNEPVVTPEPVETLKPVVTPEPVEALNETTDTTEEVTTEETQGFVTFAIDSSEQFAPRTPTKVTIKAINTDGETVTNFVPIEVIKIETSSGSANITPNRLYKNDFINGKAQFTVTSMNDNPVGLMVKTDSLMKEIGTLSEGLFADISEANPHFRAINFLKNEGVIQGYPDGTFKPSNSVSRVEVTKFILEGIGAELSTAKGLAFSDTDKTEWYADYLYTAYNLGLIKGYPDGTFKPTMTVNKVEFLKMLISAMNIDIDPKVVRSRFTDVDKNQWYAPYVEFAVQKNLIDTSGNRFYPNEKMTREEVAEAIYRLKVLKETGQNTYTAELGDQFEVNAG